jgi:lipopolysaccharide transport system ATP-binding protein
MSVADDAMAVLVRDLGKQYRIGRLGPGSLYDRAARLTGATRSDAEPDQATVWALRGVSFRVARGEVLGVLGRNGSGKSTLMKILARVTAPTEGSAMVRGRVGALLQAGTGFHPQLTGRDNISLSGAILGMSPREVEEVREQIVEFAEIGRFLDTPVKHYSSGMYLRLAFSVSAHMEAEIMLIDEVLSVGDAEFQQKCRNRIRALVAGGRTVLFVSHSIGSVRDICSRAIVLDGGSLLFSGQTEDAIRYYESDVLHVAQSVSMAAQ